jgi:hypothetical protein
VAHRLEERCPDAQVWTVRAGSRFLAHFRSPRSVRIQ